MDFQSYISIRNYLQRWLIRNGRRKPTNTSDATLPQERAANVINSTTPVPEVEFETVKFEPDVCVCGIKLHSVIDSETLFSSHSSRNNIQLPFALDWQRTLQAQKLNELLIKVFCTQQVAYACAPVRAITANSIHRELI